MTPLERKRAHERGFTVIETLLATALLVALGLATLGLVSGMARAVGARSTSSGGTADIESAIAAMRSDSATAYAVFVPEDDVFGNSNGSATTPAHELDYYARAEDGTESWWAYRFDAAAGTLRRWDYQPSATEGGAATVGATNRLTGVIDTAASYPAATGVRAFNVQTLEANQLATTSNTFGPLIASLASGAGATPAPEPVGFVPASKTVDNNLYGGNTTIEVSLSAAHTQRTFHLSTSALPSGFTIHAAPAIRAFAYRLDFMHRFWFGFAQKTWARIYEQLQYSYAPKTPGSWKVLCDYQVYGAGTDGLALNDPHASYVPSQWNESTAGVFYSSMQGDLQGLNPAGCDKKIPGPTAAPATPSPQTTDPNVTDTPPPCFAAGQCWPQNAPVNWAPPSPWPSGTAPPQWCATHELSTLCGGPGGTPQPYPPGATPNPNVTTYPQYTPYPISSFRPINPHDPIGNPL